MTNLKTLIASPFYPVHNSIKNDRYTHYWLKGGRGSTKSSFVSIEIILGIMKDPNANALVLRKVGENLKDSVYEQLEWAIRALGVDDVWQSKLSPLELIYKPTGQRIIFRGGDKPKKIKSTKFKNGYCKFLWYEEVDEFRGMEEIRTINQSLMRGGNKFTVFYSYNPPKSKSNWVNTEILNHREDRLIHHSTYLDVPREWLGDGFISEAEYLASVSPKTYDHEFMGIVTGTGGNVFENVTIRNITENEINTFDYTYYGNDWGWYPDPNHFVGCYFYAAERKLYIFKELRCWKTSNLEYAELLKDYKNVRITADWGGGERKSIQDMRSYGFDMFGAVKGPGSVEAGLKWLQGLNEIIIDNQRCPYTADEFVNYEYERNKDKEVISGYPDKNNHSIDAVRYALESLWRRRGA